MNTSISKNKTCEVNEQNIASDFNSIHDTDRNTSKDCDDTKISPF